jgi:DNA-binding MarR family transcriptional regulator
VDRVGPAAARGALDVVLASARPARGRRARVPGPGGRRGLDALLTPARARLLRLLDGESPMSRLAMRSGIAAGAATDHVHALVAAGLVSRRRAGRRRLASRTARGEVLLDRYGAG